MKRRNFLRTAGATAALTPFLHSGFAINPLAKSSMFGSLGNAAAMSGKIMVFIELNGGNDGLNTLIPLDQYSKLSLHRSGVLIPENKVLPLNGYADTGLHPSMGAMQQLFNDGLMSIVHDVGYPQQDYSHFRSMDIWHSASASDQYLDTGWMGRTLQGEHPSFPTGYPNDDTKDPLAIQIGSSLPLAFMGSGYSMGMTLGNANDFDNVFVNDLVEPAPPTPYGDELEYIRLIQQQSQVYYEVIKEAAEAQPNNLSPMYPPLGENGLADQLRVVARLIGGEMQTPVYVVSIGGFDTHSEQVIEGSVEVEGQDSKGGDNHALLLRKLSEAIAAFQDDIERMGKADIVAGMTFSEFGRTIASNFSTGTDHGAAAPLFVFGKGVNPGIIGNNPDIPQDLAISGDVPMAYDFRQVYASVIQDWFGLTSMSSVLFNDFDILPIFRGTSAAKEDKRDLFGVSNYPNPVTSYTTILFSTFNNAHVVINLMDAQGRFILQIAEGNYNSGLHQVRFDRSNLPSGTYFYQVVQNGMGVTKKMLVF
ncbi:MAG: DUF1501 domain-containing protein [Saprospiraceae bacterium]|nr:DUF1501 domain-containing protein [Saprospiraceae bacterium]